MTAMVGPVCVDHLNFRNSRITVFIYKVLLTELDVIKVHRKSLLCYKCTKSVLVKLYKAVKSCNACGDFIFSLESCKLVKSCLTGFNGVNNVLLDCRKLVSRRITLEDINSCSLYKRSFRLGNKLNALRSRVGSLVKLTGKIFNCKNSIALVVFKRFCYVIKLRLGENRADRVIKKLLVDIFNVVSVKKSHVLYRLYGEKTGNIGKHRTGFVIKAYLFFNVYSINHI